MLLRSMPEAGGVETTTALSFGIDSFSALTSSFSVCNYEDFNSSTGFIWTLRMIVCLHLNVCICTYVTSMTKSISPSLTGILYVHGSPHSSWSQLLGLLGSSLREPWPCNLLGPRDWEIVRLDRSPCSLNRYYSALMFARKNEPAGRMLPPPTRLQWLNSWIS